MNVTSVVALIVIAAPLCQAAQPEVSPLPADASIRDTLAKNAARAAVAVQGNEYIFPELIVGGEWTTTLRLINNGTVAIPSSNLFFVDSNGTGMNATVQVTGGSTISGTGLRVTLPPGTMIELTFLGDANTKFGYAFVDLVNACPLATACSLYGEAGLRNRNSTRPDFESVFPLDVAGDVQYILWDHRNGFTSTLYLVNANNFTNTVTLEFRNPSNAVIRSIDVTMTSLSSQILTLHALVTETIGQQGVLLVRGRNSGTTASAITATLLRINPTNSYTPIRGYFAKRVN